MLPMEPLCGPPWQVDYNSELEPEVRGRSLGASRIEHLQVVVRDLVGHLSVFQQTDQLTGCAGCCQLSFEKPQP